jgi:hypothetical protein
MRRQRPPTPLPLHLNAYHVLIQTLGVVACLSLVCPLANYVLIYIAIKFNFEIQQQYNFLSNTDQITKSTVCTFRHDFG